MVGPRGQRLSGGRARRFTLARLPLRDPELSVLDDSLAGPDGESARALWTNPRAAGRALLVVSHEPWLWREADRVVEPG